MPSQKTDGEYIFVTSIRNKYTGKRIYASQYGKKAFRIKVKKK